MLKISKLKSFLKDETGATAIEYGMLASGITVVILAAVGLLADETNAMYNHISTSIGTFFAKAGVNGAN